MFTNSSTSCGYFSLKVKSNFKNRPMTNEEAIKYLRQLYPQGGHCCIDEQHIEAIGSMAIDALTRSVTKKSDQEEHASKGLDFQTFAKEMDNVFNLPSDVTKNTEEEPLNWEYAIACHFAEWQKRQMIDKFSEWVSEEFYIHPHDCNVVQYVSENPLEDTDDFVEEFVHKMED